MDKGTGYWAGLRLCLTVYLFELIFLFVFTAALIGIGIGKLENGNASTGTDKDYGWFGLDGPLI